MAQKPTVAHARSFSSPDLIGIIGVVSSFLLLWLAREVYHLPQGVVQTLIFLKLAVTGHLTIYIAQRTMFHFWEPPLPSASFFWVTESTKVVATLMTVYGIFMTLPIGWTLAIIVWAYALVAFVITDARGWASYGFTNHTSKNPGTYPFAFFGTVEILKFNCHNAPRGPRQSLPSPPPLGTPGCDSVV